MGQVDSREILETTENAENIMKTVAETVGESKSFIEALYDKVSELDENSQDYLKGKIEKEIVKVQEKQMQREKIDGIISDAKDAIGGFANGVGDKVAAVLSSSKEYLDMKNTLKEQKSELEKIDAEIEQVVKAAESLGLNPTGIPKYADLCEKSDNVKAAVEKTAADIKAFEENTKQDIANKINVAKDNIKEDIDDLKDFAKNAMETTAVIGEQVGNKAASYIAPSKELKAARVDLKKAEKRLDELNAELDQNLKIAQTLGLNPEDVPLIQQKQMDIIKVTKEAIMAREKVQDLESDAMNSVATRFMQSKDSVVGTITQAFEKAKDSIDAKITNGLGALESMKNATILAIGQAKANNMTHMTNLSEKVSSIHRAWLTRNYEHDRDIANNLQKAHDGLQTIYNVKDTFINNIKNAFSQAKAQIQKEEFTPTEVASKPSAVLDSLKSMIDSHTEAANKYAKEFSDSKIASMQKIADTQALRRAYNLPENTSLEAAMKAAKETALSQPKVATKAVTKDVEK